MSSLYSKNSLCLGTRSSLVPFGIYCTDINGIPHESPSRECEKRSSLNMWNVDFYVKLTREYK